MTVDARQLTEDFYTNYARFVNSFRALPDSRDGMKLVQRRIIATLIRTGNHGDLVASSAVVGDCNKYYHPHGDTSIYGAAVNLVNSSYPYVYGKGNFGYRGLVSAPPAAQRYTKVGLTKEAIQFLTPLFKYTDYYENENEYQEPVFIPTAIPYCLLAGSSGIGVGVVTNIPPMNREDLVVAARALLEGKTPPLIRPVAAGGGDVEIDPKELANLNTKGIASYKVKAKIRRVWDVNYNHDVFEITDVPDVVNLTKIAVLFRTELTDKLMFVRDESQKTLKVIVGRTKKIRKITDAEILARLQKICSRNLTVKLYVSHNGVAKIMSPIQMITHALSCAVRINLKLISDQISKVEDKILFENVKKDLGNYIMAGVPDETIIRDLHLTEQQFQDFSSKSISTLRASPKDLTKLAADLSLLRGELGNPELSFGKRFGFIK